MTPERWARIEQHLGGGNGGELKHSSGRRPKFCSAFSSCALAVNAFGPFVDDGTVVAIPDAGSFAGPVAFEAQRSAGVRGYKPNLDLVAEPDRGDWLFAESKCLEYLRPHATDFSDAFVAKAEQMPEPGTASVYADFAEGDGERAAFELLDAAQLLKHFLAAKHGADGQRAVTLAYVFWEPADAEDHEPFARHRQEAERLAGLLVDPEVHMIVLSYPKLWAHWAAAGDEDVAGHVDELRDRYSVSIGASA